jgi:hypothetical protein
MPREQLLHALVGAEPLDQINAEAGMQITSPAVLVRAFSLQPEKRSIPMRTHLFGGLAVLAALTAMPVSSQSQTPAGDVAAQVRSQGFRCDEPVSAKRDVRRSRPDSAVWLLKCTNALYRVRLDPNLAARVKKLRGRS